MSEVNEHDFARTMSIVRELYKGKTLKLKDGMELAMTDDLKIGFTMKDSKGELVIGNLSTIDLCTLNKILDRNEIGIVIPKVRV